MAGRNPRPLYEYTFGVELEFRVAWIKGDRDTLPGVPKPIRFEEDTWGQDEEVRTTVADSIRQGGWRVQGDGGPVDTAFTTMEYPGWEVKSDPSIMKYDVQPDGAMWTDVELVSPAYRVRPENFRTVRDVVVHVTTAFRTSVNESCGFHVHFGRGADLFSVHELRRMGGVTYAAAQLISTLHSVLRHNHDQCPSNRWYCELAVRRIEPARMWASQARATTNYNTWVGDDADREVGGEALRETNMTTWADGKLRSSRQTFRDPPGPRPSFARYIPRGALVPEPFDEDIYRDYSQGHEPNERGAPWAVRPAVQHLLTRPTLASVAQRMGMPARAAYNFSWYELADTEIPQERTTIEFRQARGTLNPASVLLWARVVTSLCYFACAADIDRYSSLVVCCAHAEEYPDEYDVWDLLVDIGLSKEAARLQDQILSLGSVTETPWQVYRQEPAQEHGRNRAHR
ncbi:hypothetical protein DL770_004037 [Monosporascus sp. CRB-9-2]|nr:hypothetical protein DL770_004037 [Monosporascus sp. CRB-9-2]